MDKLHDPTRAGQQGTLGTGDVPRGPRDTSDNATAGETATLS